jgi:hypothetical protein
MDDDLAQRPDHGLGQQPQGEDHHCRCGERFSDLDQHFAQLGQQPHPDAQYAATGDH